MMLDKNREKLLKSDDVNISFDNTYMLTDLDVYKADQDGDLWTKYFLDPHF